MDRDNSFGNLIKQHRKTLDLTQAELARHVSCATITLTQWWKVEESVEYLNTDTCPPDIRPAKQRCPDPKGYNQHLS